jgi:hypothetical protein
MSERCPRFSRRTTDHTQSRGTGAGEAAGFDQQVVRGVLLVDLPVFHSARTVNPGQISPALRRPDRSDLVTRFEQTLDRVWDRERSLWSESVSSPVRKQTQSCLLKRTGDPHAGPSRAGES